MNISTNSEIPEREQNNAEPQMPRMRSVRLADRERDEEPVHA